MQSKDEALIHHGSAHTGAVRCVDFNKVQRHLLASAGTKGEFYVWDVSKPTTAPTAYKSTRLDEIISLAWNNKVGHIIALGGKSGALSVWDLRKKSELIHIPTRFAISSIAWHPTEATLLMTSSADDHNPVIQLWDLRNANAPKVTLSGHEKGVLSLSWCAQDPELLLSSGSDNRTLIWNPTTAEVVAELPTSSQWVHKTSWCTTQPAIIANASLDGKISLFSIQDTTASVPATVVDDTPAGDDFFDTIPKNFSAQSSSFTLKQTPKWLKRPVGATFGFGGRVAQFTGESTRVSIATYRVSEEASRTAKVMQATLESKSITELCQEAKLHAGEAEKQDWDVIETLMSEHARGALLKYLGFTKEEAEAEVLSQLGKLTLDPKVPIAEELAESAETIKEPVAQEPAEPSETTKEAPTETSVFGDDAGDDDFLATINAEKGSDDQQEDNPSSLKSPSKTTSSEPFSIFPESIDRLDKLITKAVLTGQFDVAIDVCLTEDRMSDAFMLALCGGAGSQRKVQKAYFAKTKVPYARLLSSVIAGDLFDVVRNADLLHWKEVLAILCNYAKPDDFSDLCEILGQRLEEVKNDVAHATLCYLAGAKLNHLFRIWASIQAEKDDELFANGSEGSPFEIHAKSLSKLIMKVSIFRKAVSFVDPQLQDGNDYVLRHLYAKYVEFAKMISAEGDATLAIDYLNFVPDSFEGVQALKDRLNPPAKTVQASQANVGKRLTGMRNVYTQPEPVTQAVNNATTNGYSALGGPSSSRPTAPASFPQTVVPASAPSPYAPVRAAQIQNAYAQAQQHVPQATAPLHAYQQQQPYQNMNGAYGSHLNTQASSQNSFAPPPSRVLSNGPQVLPAAQRKDITPWNDAPDLPQPAPRRATPSINRSAITSPFPHQVSPILQGFGPAQAAALAPPPKTRSPAPTRAPPAPAPAAPPTRTLSNPYGPPVQQSHPSGLQGPPGPFPNASVPTYPPSGQSASAAYAPQQMMSPAQMHTFAPPPAQPSQTFSSPPAVAAPTFAPPPKATTGPPKAGPKSQSPIVRSPNVGTGVFLEKESSRPGSPAQTKSELPPTKYPLGDRSHIPHPELPIFNTLSSLLQRLRAISPDKYRRPLDDTDRRLSILYDQLNNSQLSPGTLAQIHMLAACIASSDWGRGYAIHLELTGDKMHEVRDWIVGIKTLIVVGKKSEEERWEAQASQM